jgi:hypothetical protein
MRGDTDPLPAGERFRGVCTDCGITITAKTVRALHEASREHDLWKHPDDPDRGTYPYEDIPIEAGPPRVVHRAS